MAIKTFKTIKLASSIIVELASYIIGNDTSKTAF